MELPEQITNKMSTEEIHISRIPLRTKRWFQDYAQDYFCGDYGLCLKHVIDVFRGMTPIGYDELQEQINELTGEINSLKEHLSNMSQNKAKVKKMADGTEHKGV